MASNIDNKIRIDEYIGGNPDSKNRNLENLDPHFSWL